MSAGSFTRNLHVLEKGPKARFFVSKLGRFGQPDIIVPGAANPQNLNRYSYVLNSPIGLVDPSGHKSICADGVQCQGTGLLKHTTYSSTQSQHTYTWTPYEGENPPSIWPEVDNGHDDPVEDDLGNSSFVPASDPDQNYEPPDEEESTNVPAAFASVIVTALDIYALALTLAGAGLTVFTCIAGEAISLIPAIDGVVGCKAGMMFYERFINPFENLTGYVSLGLTAYAELLTGDLLDVNVSADGTTALLGPDTTAALFLQGVGTGENPFRDLASNVTAVYYDVSRLAGKEPFWGLKSVRFSTNFPWLWVVDLP